MNIGPSIHGDAVITAASRTATALAFRRSKSMDFTGNWQRHHATV
jgi:hypothetical protein